MRCSGLWCRCVAIVLLAALAAPVFAQPPAANPAVVVHAHTSNQSHRERVEFAARAAWADYTEWLGPHEPRALTLTRLPWRSAAPTMDLESLVAYETARLWWRDRFGDNATVNGIAWYLQSRVVERLYDLVFQRPGHSSESARVFGAAIPWALPHVRLSRWTAGLGREEWVRGVERWPASGRRLPESVDAQAIGVAIALASFEHAAGWPALQAALYGAAQAPSSTTDLARAVNDAAGVTILTGAAAAGDVAIAAVSEAPCGDRPCRILRVTVVRDETLLGATVPLRVQFTDGQVIDARLGANERLREFVFESGTRYAAVYLDPDRVVLADVNRLNNVRLAAPASNVPVAKWTARWLAWLEDAMLSYSALF